MFFAGFKIGAIVGGIFGGLMGTYYAVTYRAIQYIPLAAIGSGASFGFFMGIGMVMRTQMEEEDGETYINEMIVDDNGKAHFLRYKAYKKFEI